MGGRAFCAKGGRGGRVGVWLWVGWMGEKTQVLVV